MTDNEIIKALACCVYDDYAKCHYNCLYKRNCRHLTKDALDLINRQKAEIERHEKENNENFNKWMLLDERTKERYAELYEEAKCVVRAKAIKEFAERAGVMITEVYNKHIFGNNDLEAEEKEAIMNFSDDITSGFDGLVKEMTEEFDGKL